VKTKGKPTFIVTIIGAILFLAATVTPSLEALRLLKEIQSRLHRQQYNLVHFIVSGEDDYRENFISRRSSVPVKGEQSMLFQHTKENKPWNTRCP
jgi:uncharacterized protein YllA (UPF0747 family)